MKNDENNSELGAVDSTQTNINAIENAPESSGGINPIRISIPAADENAGGLTFQTQDTNDNWRERAKIFAPAIKQCALLLSATTVKILGGQLRSAGVEKNRAMEIAEIAEMDDETIETYKNCGSRILARRCKNEEAADWIAVGGATAAWVASLSDVVLEIRKLRQEIRIHNQ